MVFCCANASGATTRRIPTNTVTARLVMMTAIGLRGACCVRKTRAPTHDAQPPRPCGDDATAHAASTYARFAVPSMIGPLVGLSPKPSWYTMNPVYDAG